VALECTVLMDETSLADSGSGMAFQMTGDEWENAS